MAWSCSHLFSSFFSLFVLVCSYVIVLLFFHFSLFFLFFYFLDSFKVCQSHDGGDLERDVCLYIFVMFIQLCRVHSLA